MHDKISDQQGQTGIAHDLTGQAQALLDRGKKRSEALVNSRRRNELFKELGAAVYDARPDGGDVIDLTACDGLFAQLDELQPTATEPPTT